MQGEAKRAAGAFLSDRHKLTAFLLLWALVTVVFAPAFALAGDRRAPAGMVYCPLTHIFQPAHAAVESKGLDPFADICAGKTTKRSILVAIAAATAFRKVDLDQRKLDNLAFSYLAHGRSALSALPGLPDLPPGRLVKQTASGSIAGNDSRKSVAGKQAVPSFSLDPNARPAPATSIAFFSLDPTHLSSSLSRRIAPRGPPARS